MPPPPIGSIGDLRRYLDFEAGDEEAVRSLAGRLDVAAMIDDFYERLLSDPSARAVLQGEEQVAALKASLASWVVRVTTGPWDDAYAVSSEAIGRRHVAVGLPQRFMPLAMNAIRSHFRRAALASAGDPDERARLLEAVDKVLDLELTLMLDSYHRAHLDASRGVERLRAVGQLAGGISHELKNPLGVIRTGLTLVRKRLAKHDGDEFAELLDRIDRGARMAGEFANRLLEFSRVKTPRARRFPVRALVDDALARVGDVADLDLQIEIEPPDAEGRGDPNDLARALADLIANAVAACREHGIDGKIVVRAHRRDDDLVLEVRDQGPGIPLEDQQRVFEPLFTTRRHATGLGLALCRELVTAHGGAVELESEPGQGARFLIRLPQD
ncbi:MAG: protoglobin domain-containing protein [Planctomycetota bacterium JB042]